MNSRTADATGGGAANPATMVAASPVRGALRWPVDLLAAAICCSAAKRPREGGREARREADGMEDSVPLWLRWAVLEFWLLLAKGCVVSLGRQRVFAAGAKEFSLCEIDSTVDWNYTVAPSSDHCTNIECIVDYYMSFPCSPVVVRPSKIPHV
jgi:hypothetical protein